VRALVLAVVLSGLAMGASAAETCMPTEAEEARVMETMTRVKEPDFASLGAGKPSVVGCGLWSLEISADGRVKALKIVRSQGGESLRGAVEPWIKALRFEPGPKDWSGLMPVTLESDGKK